MWSLRKRAVSVAWALVLSMALGVGPAKAGSAKDVLKLVPADAWGFAVVKSLGNFDKKAETLKEALGLGYETPVTSLALAPLGLGDELDTSKPVCVVFLDAQKLGGPQNAGVLLVPAKDPRALLEKLSAEEAQEGVSKCTVAGEPSFAAVKGNVVVLGQNEDAVVKIVKSKKTLSEGFAESRLAALEKSDVYVSISVHLVVSAYKEMLMPMMQMMSAPSGVGAQEIEQLFKMLEEMQSLDFAVRFEQKGFALQVLSVPRPESDLARLYGDEKNTKEPLLALLPKDKYLLAIGSTATNSELKKKFGGDKPLSGVLKMLQLGELDAEALKTLDATLLKLQESIKRYAVSVNMLADGSDGIFGVCLVAQTDDAKQFTEGVRTMYKAVGKVTDDEDFGEAMKSVRHEAEAETIAGKKVDTIKVDVDGLARMSESDEEDVKRLKTLLGKECVVRFGPCDDKHFVLSFGGGSKQFEAICGAVKSSGDALSTDAGIKSTSGELPSPRVGEAYLALDHVAQALKSAAKAMGEEEEFPFDLPTLNAPIALSNAVRNEISQTDIVVPMALIKAGKEAFDKYAARADQEEFDEDEEADAPQAGKKPGKEKPQPEENEDEGEEEGGESDE